MSEYTIAVPMHDRRALEVIRNAINDPDSLHDMVYAAFREKVSDWAEHGWELEAVAEGAHIFVTARRKA